MWKLWHKLFGWQYARVQFGYNHLLVRVHFDGNGEPYVVLYDKLISLKTTEREWYPLTFRTSMVKGGGGHCA